MDEKIDEPTPQNQSLVATLADVKTTVNGVSIGELTEPIAQDATIDMDFVFATVLTAPTLLPQRFLFNRPLWFFVC